MAGKLTGMQKTFYAYERLKEPLNSRTIFYSSAGTAEDADNTAGMLELLIGSDIGKDFTHIVCVNNFHKNYSDFKERYRQYDNIRYVSEDSREYISAAMRSEYVVSDGEMPSYYIKREGQIHINLLSHKKYLGCESPKSVLSAVFTKVQRTLNQSSYILYETDEVKDKLNRLFRLDEFFNGVLIRSSEPCCFAEPEKTEVPEPSDSGEFKYSEKYILELMGETASGETEEPDECIPYFNAEDAPSKEESSAELLSLFGGDKINSHRLELSGRKRVLFISEMNNKTPFISNICNIIEKYDPDVYDVTVFAVDTSNTSVLISLANRCRVIVRTGYMFCSEEQRERMDKARFAEKMDADFWKNEIKRTIGSDDFDILTLTQKPDPFWTGFCSGIHAKRKILVLDSQNGKNNYGVKLEAEIEKNFDLILHAEESESAVSAKGEKHKLLPMVINSRWNKLLENKPDFIKVTDGKNEYYALKRFENELENISFIPPFDGGKTNFFCAVNNYEDAEKAAEAFKNAECENAVLYLQILADCKVPEASADNIVTIADAKVSLLLLSLCDVFVEAYSSYGELGTAAGFMGLYVSPNRSLDLRSMKCRLLLDGPPEDSLYCGYSPRKGHDLRIKSSDFKKSDHISSYDKRSSEVFSEYFERQSSYER